MFLGHTRFESFPKDVAALSSHVFSSLSNVKLLDTMKPKYVKFTTVSSDSRKQWVTRVVSHSPERVTVAYLPEYIGCR